jgi:hypothetical protein
LLKAHTGTSCCLSHGGSMLVAGFKRLAELVRRGWLCGAQRRSLVCLNTVKPFVYTGGTPVSWRHLAARGLFDHTPDAGGVVALCSLGCVLPLDYVDGCRGIVSLRVALRPHPRRRWCRGVVWSRLRASVRLRRRHGALVWTRLIGGIVCTGGVLYSDLAPHHLVMLLHAWVLMGLLPRGGSARQATVSGLLRVTYLSLSLCVGVCCFCFCSPSVPPCNSGSLEPIL